VIQKLSARTLRHDSRRLDEYSATVSQDEKILRRFQKQRAVRRIVIVGRVLMRARACVLQRRHSKRDIFNLNDDEDVLTHGGFSLSTAAVDDFDGDDSKNDEDGLCESAATAD
jgi:hypothetical protein